MKWTQIRCDLQHWWTILVVPKAVITKFEHGTRPRSGELARGLKGRSRLRVRRRSIRP